jgi:hypothetical protein
LLQSPGEDVAKSRHSRAFTAAISGVEVANSTASPMRGVLVASVLIALVRIRLTDWPRRRAILGKARRTAHDRADG